MNTGTQEIQTFTTADKQKLQTVQELHKKKTLVKQGVGVKATENALLYQVRARDTLLINGDKVIRSWGNQLDYHFLIRGALMYVLKTAPNSKFED